MSFCMTQFYIFLLFHFNDLSLDIRKQVLLLDAKSGCLQNAKESPESRQLLHKLLVIPSIHMGFTRFNCFRLHGISVALVSVDACVGKSPWRIMFGFKGIANYKSPYGPFQLPSLKDQRFLSFFITLNQSTYTTRSWRFEVMHRRIFGGRRPFAVECCSQPPKNSHVEPLATGTGLCSLRHCEGFPLGELFP